MNAPIAGRAKAAGAKIIRYLDVVKRYGDFTALLGVSLDVHAGEVVCLIGPSGSGKSTLLRCTNGLETIDGGDIEFEGTRLPRDERALRAVRQRMGMVFQSFELFPHLTAQQNVAEGPRTVLRKPAAEADRAEALDRFCADLDVQIGLTILKSELGQIAGTRLRGVAEAAGFRINAAGHFEHAQEETGAAMYTLQNYTQEPFSVESLRRMTTPGVVFVLDVPRVADPVRKGAGEHGVDLVETRRHAIVNLPGG